MADIGFLLSLELTKQGRIHGPVVRKIGSAYSQGWIECHGFDFDTESPRDPQSGLPTGRRRYSDVNPERDSTVGLEPFRLPFGFVARSGFAAASPRDTQAGLGALTRVAYGAISPRDVHSGLATGKRQHKPFMIYKVIDATSPQLLRAAATGESLKSATLAFLNPDGDEALVRLLDCKLVKIDPAPHHLGFRSEVLTFVYEKLWINGMPSEDSALLRVAQAV